ncbi:hypothetical protein XELAEV_18035047mg [Xenopus laevis]|uniref:Uncharacterized protein n=1 Tax=Xenopus laevis TaxID=8355 RepID=A0A974CGA1_XENLA|nr:hypothetical protein XELAEV_18035047mg [Xenopus laevis]
MTETTSITHARTPSRKSRRLREEFHLDKYTNKQKMIETICVTNNCSLSGWFFTHKRNVFDAHLIIHKISTLHVQALMKNCCPDFSASV